MTAQVATNNKLLIMVKPVSEEVTVVVKDPAVDLNNTTKSLAVYDEKGVLIGYIALFAAPTL